MSVEFEEERKNNFMQTEGPRSGMTKWLVVKGFASDEKTANQILVAAAVLMILIGIIVAYAFLKTPQTHPVARPTPPASTNGNE